VPKSRNQERKGKGEPLASQRRKKLHWKESSSQQGAMILFDLGETDGTKRRGGSINEEGKKQTVKSSKFSSPKRHSSDQKDILE